MSRFVMKDEVRDDDVRLGHRGHARRPDEHGLRHATS